MPNNTAAWINVRNARLEVGPAPYTPPGDDQLVVRNRAVAINPLDWIIQTAGSLAYRWLTYPTVLGSDTAGEVVEVGRAVTRFRVGDRVLGHAVGTDKDSNNGAEGTFQQYTVLLERMAAPIPPSLSFEEAAVLPLATSTAACGLFQADQLGLRPPSPAPEATGETVLVWGGSTSVGSSAIQLAVAAGYEVVTTASPRNFEYVQSLGASAAFDYNSPGVVADVIAAVKGRTLAGAIAIGPTSGAGCARILGACTGSKFISIASPPVSFAGLADPGHSRLMLPGLVLRLVGSTAMLAGRTRWRGIRTNMIFGTTLKANEVSTLLYRDFLPAALASRDFVAAPKPVIAGHGLADIQAAMDAQVKGVSAAKVVVTIP